VLLLIGVLFLLANLGSCRDWARSCASGGRSS